MAPARVPISKRLVAINSASQIFARLLYVGVIVWAIQHLIKRVPPEEYALLPVMLAVTMFVPLLHSLLVGGLSRYVTEAYAKDDLQRVTKLTSSMFPIVACAGIFVTLVGIVLAWQAERVFRLEPQQVSDVRFMVMLLMLSAAISFALAPFSVGLVVCQRYVLQNMLQLASILLRVVLMLILLLGVGPQVKWVIVSQVAGNLAFVVGKSVVSRRLLPSLAFRAGDMNWSLAREVFGFNGWHSLFGISTMIRDGSDPFILKWFSTPIAVAAFDIGGMVDRELRRLSSLASEPLYPVMTAMHALNQEERLRNTLLRGGRIGLWAIMAPVVVVAVFSQELFSLYLGATYTTYQSCVPVVLLLLGVYPTFYARWMLHKVAVATANLKQVAMLTFAMHMVNTLLTLYLVAVLDLGAVGSAAGTFISTTFFNLFLFWPLCVRTVSIRWSEFFGKNVLPGVTPAAIAGVVGLATRETLHLSALGTLVIGATITLIVYVIVMLSISFQTADKQDLRRILRKFPLGRQRPS